MDRRTFIAASSTALLGGMLGGIAPSHAAASLSVRPTNGGPLVTPNGNFFLYSQLRYPTKLPTGVQIDGLVNTSARYSLDDLAKVPQVKKTLTLECFVNTAGGALIFNTPFEGAPLPALLQKAGVKPEAKAARIECSDGHPFVLPLTELMRPETMMVGKFGGQPVPMEHGSPYTRLFIPGAGGNHHPKWVTRITLIANDAAEHPAPPMAGFLKPTPPTVRARSPASRSPATPSPAPRRSARSRSAPTTVPPGAQCRCRRSRTRTSGSPGTSLSCRPRRASTW